MAAPIATEKVLRGLARAFLSAGIISSSSDVQKILSIPNDATDASIDAILATINFGGVAGATDVVRGEGDVNIFIDSDNNDTAAATQRFFRVAQDQSDPPVTSSNNELCTVTRDVASDPPVTTYNTILRLGPRYNLVNPGSYYTGSAYLGAKNTGHYGYLYGGPHAIYGNLQGLLVKAPDNLEFRSDGKALTRNVTYACRGGWNTLATKMEHHVGDVDNDESIMMEAFDVGGGHNNYGFRTTVGNGYIPTIYMIGSDATTDYGFHFLVGGRYGETWGTPANMGSATLAVVGDNYSNTANALFVYDRKTTRQLNSEVFTVKGDTNGVTYYTMRAYRGATAIFRLQSDGNCFCLGTFQNGSGDVAEAVVTDWDYEPGTVLAAQDGFCSATVEAQQTNVVGVVSTKPGMEIGQFNLYDRSQSIPLLLELHDSPTNHLIVQGHYSVVEIGTHICVDHEHLVEIDYVRIGEDSTEIHLLEKVDVAACKLIEGGITKALHHAPLAVCGLVPVKCIAPISPGDRLVSAPDGFAVASQNPAPGSVIGKAYGKLIEGTGLVKTFISPQ